MEAVEKVIKTLATGGFVIVTDDKERENEGDLFLLPEFATPEKIGFMIRHTGGIICMAMTQERLEELQLPQMVEHNTDSKGTAFTISVDYRHGTTTGISASDRCTTVQALINPSAVPHDFTRPGHVFPLRYREGGVLKRAGHTEAAVDLAKLSGHLPACLISELMNDDGTMMREGQLVQFAERFAIPMISIADLIRFRRKREKLIHCVSQATIPTAYGPFTAYVFESTLDGIEHMALVKGEVKGQKNVLVRVHSECLTGDVFGSHRCDCGPQLQLAMKKIADEGTGVIVYLRGHEGRGIGLGHKLRAYSLQDGGCDTVEANLQLGLPVDSREYGIGAQILADFEISTVRLMTNNPAKYGGIEGYDIEIVERVPLITELTESNRSYLQTKQDKMGHFLNI